MVGDACWHQAQLLPPVGAVCRGLGPGHALPVLVAQGAQPGPTLLVSAGIHGNEYDEMVALRRVWEELDPSELSGTFVAIMCCNVDAHLVPDRNSAYDGQNLARVFPGKVDGTLTERVAYCIQHDFIEKCSLMCDLHTAGLDMSEQPVSDCTLPTRSAASVCSSVNSQCALPTRSAMYSAAYSRQSRRRRNDPNHWLHLKPAAAQPRRSRAGAFRRQGLRTKDHLVQRGTEHGNKTAFFCAILS